MSLSEAVLVRPARDRLALAPQALERLVKVWDRYEGTCWMWVQSLVCVAIRLDGGNEVRVVDVAHVEGKEGELHGAVVKARISFGEAEAALRESSQKPSLFLCDAEFGRLRLTEQAG